MLLIAICFILTGILVGLLSGLFGLGGGLTVVPVMMIFLAIYEPTYSANFMHIAIATSLFVMIFTSIISTYSHHKAKNIVWKIVLPLKVGVIIGTIFGAIAATFLSSKILKIFFIFFLIFTILKWAYKLFTHKNTSNIIEFEEPKKILAGIYGFITGSIAVLLGIGSSVMIVPFLKHRNFTISQAAAIASAITPFIALFGAITYIITGYNNVNIPSYCFGFVYMPAAIGLILGAFIGAPLGTLLSTKMPHKIQNVIYLGFLVLILLIMIS
ncbi:sulfite exporter TauE/SafE family protein [Francisella frigiditurris]|uniref:Probable membrane transporter protein n=1 Tax=Francisella frigiditurris TaxID=1542390 RepID=A0A1J0KR77_9GAMM|nr:sulfite exporter TauE/SafE family protein [Francisella frigiditurris]APC96202.1 sulfite exporter TauE/SafE family protein [Francisella frigiditurris]